MPKEPLTQFTLSLNITNWAKSTDQLFDYQSNQAKQAQQFRSEIYKLSVPKVDRFYYYFFYAQQWIDHSQKNLVIIQRRKQYKPRIKQIRTQSNNHNLQLIGGIKIFIKKNNDVQSLFMKVLSAESIYQQCNINMTNMKFDVPYIIVRTFSKGYPLKVKQILKLGRNQYLIKEIQDGKHNIDYNNYSSEELLILQRDKEVKMTSMNQKREQDEKMCKICYDESQIDTNDGSYNPLLNPCKCSGSNKYIHMNCLSSWITQKIRKLRSNGEGNYYQFKQLFCQICHHPFPKAVLADNKYHSLINFIEQEMFVGLQKLNTESKRVRNSRREDELVSYISLSKQNKRATIGRLLDSGVVLEEMTVSRRHAVLQYTQNKGFKIKDLSSKFGTLIYQEDAEIQLKQKYRSFQIGSIIFNFKLIHNKY